MNPHRVNIITLLQLVARHKEQVEYQRKVPSVNVATEMCCQWFDDFYHPEFEEFKVNFSKPELMWLAKFNEVFEDCVDELPETLDDFHRDPRWQKVTSVAESLLIELGWQDIRPIYDRQ
ncbi:hypothetical protein EZV61_12335 [Corallincola luteus]|uniref:Uncharacterized protein n=1 Tax=Corallincola luteus TaxID=1775177 RepID=A0ABY2AIL9_9GAMM|nr:hypothetical protein [Corallincola luteus]TCI02585.1 hypothetical protein EZV61_12335 [Corallincola luteus]